MKHQKYTTCERCSIVVPLHDDGRPVSHVKMDGKDWCDGARRSKFDADPTNAEEHQARHRELYRSLRELFEDYIHQTNPASPKAVTVIEFLGWAREQHNGPTHTDLKPHQE